MPLRSTVRSRAKEVGQVSSARTPRATFSDSPTVGSATRLFGRKLGSNGRVSGFQRMIYCERFLFATWILRFVSIEPEDWTQSMERTCGKSTDSFAPATTRTPVIHAAAWDRSITHEVRLPAGDFPDGAKVRFAGISSCVNKLIGARPFGPGSSPPRGGPEPPSGVSALRVTILSVIGNQQSRVQARINPSKVRRRCC